MDLRVPILRTVGALLIISAGAAFLLGITVTSSVSLVFIFVGAAILLLALLGRGSKRGDVALFAVGLLILATFTSTDVGALSPGTQRISHTVMKAMLSNQLIDLVASTDKGGISIFYSTKSNLAYQVNFTRTSSSFGSLGGSIPSTSLTNETQEDVFVLNATAHSYDISIAIGTGYLVNMTANTGTGSINVKGPGGVRLGNVFLQSGTGTITANLTSQSIREVALQAGTGSISLYSNHLTPNGARIPVKLQAGTGSVNLDVKIVKGTAVLLEASAGLGNVNQNLQGFTVSSQSTRSNLVAQAADVSAAGGSFIVQASTGAGSVTVNAQFTG